MINVKLNQSKKVKKPVPAVPVIELKSQLKTCDLKKINIF